MVSNSIHTLNIISNASADSTVTVNRLLSEGGAGGAAGKGGAGGDGGAGGGKGGGGGTAGFDGADGATGVPGSDGADALAGVGLALGTGVTVNISGAADLDLGRVTGADITLDASALSGDFTVATDHEDQTQTIQGGSGRNQITLDGGVDHVDLAQSQAQSDTLIILGATGQDATAGLFTTVSDFGTMAAHGDVLKIGGYSSVVANGPTVVDGTLTVQVLDGIATFDGAGAGSLDLAAKTTAAFKALNEGEALAFVHDGHTYLAVERIDSSAYNKGIDLVIQLTGVDDLTALGATAADHTLVLQSEDWAIV